MKPLNTKQRRLLETTEDGCVGVVDRWDTSTINSLMRRGLVGYNGRAFYAIPHVTCDNCRRTEPTEKAHIAEDGHHVWCHFCARACS